MIHDNQFGKGVWMKLPEDGTTRLSRMTKAGMDEAGKPVWNRETRTVSNSELKALMESYKDKTRGSVLSDLSGRKVQDTASKNFGRTDVYKRQLQHLLFPSVPSVFFLQD